MELVAPSIEAVDAVADLWVALARGQRAYGSHVHPEESRTAVRESVARHVVTGGILVARAEDDENDGGAQDGDDDGGRAGDGAGDADDAGDDQPLLGFVTFTPETGGYDTDCQRGVIENLYVVPERRGEGIGGELLSAAEARLFDAGVDAVALEAMAENEAARRFYDRHGYELHRVELEKRAESDTDSKEDR